MAAKNLPVVGEAFLGSDPLVSKVVRIAVGVDTTDGINDVVITGTASSVILTVSDTKWMIVGMVFRIVEAFSAVNDVQIGINGSATLYAGLATQTANAFNALGTYVLRVIDTGADVASGAGPFDGTTLFPTSATASLIVTPAVGLPTVGNMEMYVYYVETP